MRFMMTGGSDSIVDVGGPPTLQPMLIGSVGVPADAPERLVEPKWDGVRVVATVGAGRARLVNRNGRDVTAAYPELHGPPAVEAVLDGEVVAFDEAGRANFGRLQRRMHVRNPSAALVGEVPVAFMAFDLLWCDGELLVDQPLDERRRRLDALGLDRPPWVTSPVLDLPPEALERHRRAGLAAEVGELPHVRHVRESHFRVRRRRGGSTARERRRAKKCEKQH
ncbi:MAG TPA: hypothetical protein VMU14_02025, partial [Acidimicrobiales bacterium]|nr:hypothetical protein [Acidimicrobiales bacterium]